MKTEKEWTTKAGLKATVIATDMGHRCGYVSVPKDHPWHGKSYDDVGLDVHGGLTYAGEKDDLWWFGYDCAHLGDARDPELMSDEFKSIRIMLTNFEGDTVKTLDFCVNECESMAWQLKEIKVLTQKEFQAALAKMWSEAVEAECKALIEAAVLAEREACAKVCDLVAREMDDTNGTTSYIGKLIRARGNK